MARGGATSLGGGRLGSNRCLDRRTLRIVTHNVVAAALAPAEHVTGLDAWVDKCVDMYVDMCIGMCIDNCILAYLCGHGHAYRHMYQRVCVQACVSTCISAACIGCLPPPHVALQPPHSIEHGVIGSHARFRPTTGGRCRRGEAIRSRRGVDVPKSGHSCSGRLDDRICAAALSDHTSGYDIMQHIGYYNY